MKKILFITLASIGLSFLASSCVKEEGFENRVRDIVNAQYGTLVTRVDSLYKEQVALNDSLKNVKKDVEKLSKQSKDLTDSIAAVKDSLAIQKAWTEDELKKIDDRVTALETEQKSFKTEVYERLGKLESRIQKIDVIPEYNDGSVRIGKGDFEFSFIIRPDSVAQKVADSIELFKLLATRTLTKSSVQFDTIALKGVSYEKGIVTITIDGSKFPAKMLDSTKSHSGCLVISDGNSETTSGFFPMTQVRYPEFRDSVCMFVKGTWWATVNCGYVKNDYNYGKLYQWGRKYGCGYNNGTTYTELILQTLTAAKFNSTTNINDSLDVAGFNNWFYKNGSSPFDWYANDASKQLKSWPMKSGDAGYMADRIANPCPSGWRVPTYDELNALIGNSGSTSIGSAGWDSSKNGYWFNGTTSPSVKSGLFLPAAGSRSFNYGSAAWRGSKGDYWSSSVNGSNAKFLIFDSDISRMFNSARASGFSVRCVQE